MSNATPKNGPHKADPQPAEADSGETTPDTNPKSVSFEAAQQAAREASSREASSHEEDMAEEVEEIVASALSEPPGSHDRMRVSAHDTRPCEDCDYRGVTDRVGGADVYCDCQHGRRKHYEHFQRIHDRIPESGVPKHLSGVTLESLREAGGEAVMQSEAVHAVQGYLNLRPFVDPTHGTEHESVCILGPNGKGKTGLLTILARKAYREGFTPLFVKYADLYSAVQAGYGQFVKGSPQHDLGQIRVETAQRVDVLCLDDLGDPFAEGQGDYNVPKDRRDILFRVLSSRHEAGRPTHITANHASLQEIARQFDPRIADRIKEMCAVVQMDGPNLREVQ
jgi:DNA replication protein DnaC